LRTGDEPLASRIYYNRALALANLGKWEEAVIDYEKAVARNPKIDPIMVHALGAAYLNTKRYQDALVQFDKAIALSPEYAKAYFDRGMTLKLLNRDGSAMQDMNKSCELKYPLACVIVKFDPHRK
jgi:tetratricopeptide (TPR) repeat protein